MRLEFSHNALKRRGRRTAPPLIELSMLMAASRAVETNTETAEDLAYLRGRGTSLGGLRPKCSVIDEEGALNIGKFPSVDDERAVTKGEVLAMQLAKAAGINATPARLIDSDGVPVTLIRRFDRAAGADSSTSPRQHCLAATWVSPTEHTYTESSTPSVSMEQTPRRISRNSGAELPSQSSSTTLMIICIIMAFCM
ncbi:MAG: HipA domain-containing protein [Steroidobacteraceae bacterium]